MHRAMRQTLTECSSSSSLFSLVNLSAISVWVWRAFSLSEVRLTECSLLRLVLLAPHSAFNDSSSLLRLHRACSEEYTWPFRHIAMLRTGFRYHNCCHQCLVYARTCVCVKNLTCSHWDSWAERSLRVALRLSLRQQFSSWGRDR